MSFTASPNAPVASSASAASNWPRISAATIVTTPSTCTAQSALAT
jgi:hypothetical protein